MRILLVSLLFMPFWQSSAYATTVIGMLSIGGENPVLAQDSMIAYIYWEPLKNFRLKPADGAPPFLITQLKHLKVGRIYAVEADVDPVVMDSDLKIPVMPTHVHSIRSITAFGNDCAADLVSVSSKEPKE